MPQRRSVYGFALKLALFYGLLVFPWPGWRDTYAAGHRAIANRVFGSFGSLGSANFRPSTDPGAKHDTVMAIRSRQSPVEGATGYDARLEGYLPAAVFIALHLATPVPWARKWRTFLLGLIVIHVFVALRITIALFHFFNSEGPWRAVHLGPWATKALGTAFEFGVASPVCTFLVPGLVWLFLSFRLADIAGYWGTSAVAEKTVPTEDPERLVR